MTGLQNRRIICVCLTDSTVISHTSERCGSALQPGAARDLPAMPVIRLSHNELDFVYAVYSGTDRPMNLVISAAGLRTNTWHRSR